MIRKKIKEVEARLARITGKLYTPEMAECEAQLKVLRELQRETEVEAKKDGDYAQRANQEA